MNKILIYYVTCFVCKNTVYFYFYFLRCQLFAVILCILYILTSFFGSVNIGNQYMNKSTLYCKNNFLSIICCIVRITFCLSFYIFIFISFFSCLINDKLNQQVLVFFQQELSIGEIVQHTKHNQQLRLEFAVFNVDEYN